MSIYQGEMLPVWWSRSYWKGVWQKANKQPPATSLHVMLGNEDAERQDWIGLYRVSKGNDRMPISVTMEVENREHVMELDRGSAVSVIGEEKYHEQLRHVPLEAPLYSYTRIREKRWNCWTCCQLEFVMENKASIFSCMWWKELDLHCLVVSGCTPSVCIGL